MKKTIPIIHIVWFAWWPVRTTLNRWAWMKKVVWWEDTDSGWICYGEYSPKVFPRHVNFGGMWTRRVR